MCPFAAKVDRALIDRALSDDPRIDVLTLAEQFGISETTARRHKRRWEKAEKLRRKADRDAAAGKDPDGPEGETGGDPSDRADEEDEDGSEAGEPKRRPPMPPLREVQTRITGPDLGAQDALNRVAVDVRTSLTVEAHERTQDVLRVGKVVRDWFDANGMAGEFPSSTEFINAAISFWWLNRDRINEQDDVILELRGLVDNLGRLLDPAMRRKHYHDEVNRMVLLASMAGNPIPTETVALLLRDADQLATEGPSPSSAIIVPPG